MATKGLSFKTLPSLPISEGSATPNPGGPCWAWSTTIERPVFWNGFSWSVNQVITVSTVAPTTPYTNQLWLDVS